MVIETNIRKATTSFIISNEVLSHQFDHNLATKITAKIAEAYFEKFGKEILESINHEDVLKAFRKTIVDRLNREVDITLKIKN